MKSTTIYFVPEYNFSESNYVKCVIDTNDLDVAHHEHVPSTGKPSSVTRVYKNGKLIQERYYDENGDVYLDIDYTDHHLPEKHPVVPHRHRWEKDEEGILRRQPWEEIKK